MNHRQTLIGCDFGAAPRAGDQANKIILIEATRQSNSHYAVTANGRNERLVRKSGGADWMRRRRGWTIVDLAESMVTDPSITVAAFDFPFSIPFGLLQDQSFARAVGIESAFRTRNRWLRFLARHLKLEFDSKLASGRLLGVESFDSWRQRSNWTKRQTDIAASAQPPLKDLYQNLFRMTLVGNVLLDRLNRSGISPLLNPFGKTPNRVAIEAYPGAVARNVGHSGSYKKQSEKCIDAALRWLQASSIKLDLDPGVRRFCETYQSAPDDHDGADALMCLITAIAYAEGQVEYSIGDADITTLKQEGCIVVPKPIIEDGSQKSV